MLAHPTLDQLHALGLYGLAKGFKELEHKPEARSLEHAEWLGLLLEYELTLRRQKQFETRARVARLRHPASVEDVNYQSPRGLDRALFLKLAACDWIAERRNLLLTGRAAWARVGSPARSATRRAEKTCPFSTPAPPDSSPIWPSPMGMSVAFATPYGMPAICAMRSLGFLEIISEHAGSIKDGVHSTSNAISLQPKRTVCFALRRWTHGGLQSQRPDNS